MAPYSGSRTITLLVAIATLISNILSALFFYQLPDDPYHLASNFGWYLHFANLLSVFGFIGALRQHAPSVAIFANYLILDTLLSTIPRFLILITITSVSSTLCHPGSSPQHTLSLSPSTNPNTLLPDTTSSASLPPQYFSSSSSSAYTSSILYALAPIQPPHSEYLTQADFTPQMCMRTVYLGQLMLGAGVVVATVLQLVGALCVRGYARKLWVREMREEEAATMTAVERDVRERFSGLDMDLDVRVERERKN